MIDLLLEAVPLWLAGLFLIAACLLAAQLGRFIRRRGASDNPDQDDRQAAAEGYIIGAIFGLLAFMIGLTFSIAVDRFDSRRALVTEEANAISTAFLRSSLFDEPHATQLQSTLRDYAHSRIAPDGLWDERMDQQLARSRELELQLWNETHAAVYPLRETDQASSFLDAINETLDVGTRRELSGTSHIPTRILASLLLYLLVASGVLGFLLGENTSQLRHVARLLYALFAFAIIVIVDLDRPRSGSIQVSQQALEQLVAKFDRVKLPTGPSREAQLPAGP